MRLCSISSKCKGRGTSNELPDAGVDTELKKTLIKGNLGILTCRFSGSPYAVFWKKGYDIWTSPTLIQWTPEDKTTGPRYDDGSCDMDENYSLIIKYVNQTDRGRFICLVSNEDGILVDNYTDVTVSDVALEMESSVKLEVGQSGRVPCRVKIRPKKVSWVTSSGEALVFIDLSNSVITRGGSGYEQNMFNISREYSLVIYNVTIQNEGLYLCVVADRDTGTSYDDSTALDVFTIILLLAVTSVFITVYVVKRRNKRKYDKVPTMVMVYNPQRHDLISYIELWKLVEFGTKEGIKDAKFEEALQSLMQEISLSTSGSRTCSKTPTGTNGNYYDRFCDWKANYVGNSQKEACLEACSKAGWNSVVDKLRDYSESTRAITLEDLEHTLWHSTANTENIIALLQELGVVHKPLEEWKDREKRVIKTVMTLLMQWRNTNKHGNQEVMLSLALEAINYTPSNLDFFRIPDSQKSEPDENEIKELLLPDLTSRHCSILIDAMENYDKASWYRLAVKHVGSSREEFWIENVIEQNRTSLFDSHQMVKDWWAEQKCSNYEKRLKLQRAAKNMEEAETDRIDAFDDKWLNTKRIEQIINLVPEESMRRLCESLNISYREEDFTEKRKLLKTVSKWRNNIPKQEHPKMIRKLSAGLQDINFGGLMSGKKGTSIYKAELVDLALDLIMDDLRPFAKALGISVRNFVSYRKVFKPSHLELGTIRLVLMLVDMYPKVVFENKDVRVFVCSILDQAGYVNAMKRFDFAFEPSYGELHSLTTECKFGYTANAKEENDAGNERVPTPPPGNEVNDGKAVECDSQKPDAIIPSQEEIGVDRKDNEPPYLQEPEVVMKKKMGEGQSKKATCSLQKLFGLTEEDMQGIPDANEASRFKVFQIWKEKVCPVLIDHRVVLAEGLKEIDTRNMIIAPLINGEFNGRETCMGFIDDMLSRMGEKRRESLLRLLKNKRDKEDWGGSETSQWIYDWVADWTKEMESWTKGYVEGAVKIKQVNEKHRNFNDKLVENGFFDLAREIMIIEQGLEVDPVMERVPVAGKLLTYMKTFKENIVPKKN
ncbi:uncharacterized protein LOC135155235 [Lytechinus pictus]|uniref:uncharacterized protein LOC135155235 n=1 Tax=Lytechinus pictus TaxID=7653 RepID=UPI0030BA22B3